MSVAAGPVELKSLLRAESRVEEQRNLFCDRYDICLDEAVEKAWTSWTCSRCPLFALVHESASVGPRRAPAG